MKVNALVKVEFEVSWNPQVFFLIKLQQSQSSPASCIFNYFWNLSLPRDIYPYKNCIHCAAYWTHFEPWFIWISRFSPCFGASCRFGLFHVFDGNLDSDLTKGRARGLLIQAALSWPQFIKSTLTATVHPISLRTFVFFYHFFLCLLRCSLICRVSKCHIKTGIHFEIKRDWLVGFHLCNSLNMAQVEWTDQLLPRLGWGGWWS